MRIRSQLLLALLGSWIWVAAGNAQPADDFGLIDGTIVFIDPEGDSRCAAVNTFNADFFIRSCDRRIVLVTSDDRLTPYIVDENYIVTRDGGAPAGHIRFATDNEGFRQVFWLSDDNFAEGADFVLQYDLETDTLSVASALGQDGQVILLAPINLRDTNCDPSVNYDGDKVVLCSRTCGIGTGAATLALCLSFTAGRSLFRRRSATC
ncbi:MAG: hypothetical protein HJJLKODD_00860 [Phycisphaerae bacterium]|nr:hypothetical protein [Phycisphaerae bacterium]